MTPFLIVSEFFAPERGGIQNSVAVIAEGLKNRVTVMAPAVAGKPAEQELGYPIIRRSLFSGRFRPRWLWLCPWLIIQHRQGLKTVIFGHYSAAVIAGWLASVNGLKYVVLVHGQDILSEQRRPVVRLFIGLVLRRATWVGVNSQAIANIVAEYRIPQAKIIRTHPAVPDEVLNIPISPQSESPRLVTVCRAVARKGVGTVIKALAELISHHPNILYDVVGAGPEIDNWHQVAIQNGVQPHVKFWGEVDEPTKFRLIDAAWVAILTPDILERGTDLEGLGLFLLESGAREKPLIGSATGGITDIVKQQQDGIVVPASDIPALTSALKQLLSDADRRTRYGRQAKILVAKEFTASVRNERIRLALGYNTPAPQDTVSVIIPAYQAEKTIARTIASIKAQTHRVAEIIVVNDGSTDQTKLSIAPYQQEIILIEQDNRGAAAARNAGAKKAAGTYLLFVDADMVLQPDMIKKMLIVLKQHPEAAFAYSDYRFGPKNFQLFDFHLARLKKMNYIHTSSLIRRTAFPGFDETLKRFQDWDLWLTMAAKGDYGIWWPENLFRVYEQRGGMSSWVPSFVYRIPLIGRGWGSQNIKKYRAAETVIRQKHHLT